MHAQPAISALLQEVHWRKELSMKLRGSRKLAKNALPNLLGSLSYSHIFPVVNQND